MGDAALALEDPGALELDVLGREVVEQPSPLTEGDEMDLELVEDARAKRKLRRAAPWTSTLLSPAARLASVIAVLTSTT